MPSLPEGLLIELVTPLTPAGSLDQAGLERLLKHTAASAAAVVAGSPGVGEAIELPFSVRLELFSHLFQNLPPKLPLFFGITGNTSEETLTFALQFEAEARKQPIPRPLYWVDLPLWWHSNRGLPQAYQELSQALDHPLVIMNHPGLIRRQSKPLKHINLRTAIFKKISTIPGVAAMIYRGEIRRFLHYHAASASRPDLFLYEADERRFLSRPGARGLVSAGAQLFPFTWQSVIKTCLFPEELNVSGNQLNQIWEWNNILLQLYDLYQFYPAPLLKLGLNRQGILDFPTVCPATPTFPARLADLFLELLNSIKITTN